MAPSIGLNLRVTGHCNQGGRKYMEDVFSVAYQQTEDEMDLEYAFFGIFDGHGGKEAAIYAKEHLMDNITKQQSFWSENDDLVLKSIREGFLKTQNDMWGDLENWAKTHSGLPSTAGTTASIAFIRRGKIFVGHVGDSGIVLGEQDEENPDVWRPVNLTRDHKPECEIELARIEAAGGKVVNKSGVPRVVWNRPRIGHTGPVRRSTPVDEIPFLAVARALGDLWSYNSKQDEFVVSPDPDLHVYTIDISRQRCLVLGTDGAFNVLSSEMMVNSVRQTEKNNEKHMLEGSSSSHQWQNPSKKLVDMAVDRWRVCKLRADNTSVVVVMLDPPGPPRAQVLRRQRDAARGVEPMAKKQACNNTDAPPLPPKPAKTATNGSSKGLAIISRFPNSKKPEEASGKNLVSGPKTEKNSGRIVHDNTKTEPTKISTHPKPTEIEPPPCPEPPNQSDAVKPSPDQGPKADKELLQSPVVSSTDCDSPAPAPMPHFVSRVPANQGPAPSTKPRKSLSRELASLALDSPAAPPTRPKMAPRRSLAPSQTGQLPVKRRGRSIDGNATGRDESDEENNSSAGLVPASKLVEVEAKCDALNTKLKMMERKVVDRTELLSAEVRALRQTVGAAVKKGEKGMESPARVLRSRNGEDGEQIPSTPGSGTKRKRGEQEMTKGAKRERTTTWAGKQLKKVEKPTRVTRRSVGGLNVAPKGRRSLNILKK